MSEHYIKFENVTKSYGSGAAPINALHDASFEINKGEFCILLGSAVWIPLQADKYILTEKKHPHSQKRAG